MKTPAVLRFLLAVCLLGVAFASGDTPKDSADKGVVMIKFGQRLEDGEIQRTNKLQWKVGTRYGYDIHLNLKQSSVVMKEVYTLPTSATFTNPESSGSREVTSVSEDSSIQTKIRKVDTSRPITIKQTYRIIESDPKGRHNMSIFLDDTRVVDLDFTIE